MSDEDWDDITFVDLQAIFEIINIVDQTDIHSMSIAKRIAALDVLYIKVAALGRDRILRLKNHLVRLMSKKNKT